MVVQGAWSILLAACFVACSCITKVHAQGAVGIPPPTGALSPNAPCPYAPDFTAADCPAQSCYAGPPNGCGSRSLIIISDQIIPDQWPAGVDFTQACNAHDTCYFTPGSNKNDCDNRFHEALLTECRRALACTDFPIVGEQCFGDASQNPLFGVCQRLADLYFGAVQRVGQDPFNRDQQEAQQYAQQCRQTVAQRAGRRLAGWRY